MFLLKCIPTSEVRSFLKLKCGGGHRGESYSHHTQKQPPRVHRCGKKQHQQSIHRPRAQCGTWVDRGQDPANCLAQPPVRLCKENSYVLLKICFCLWNQVILRCFWVGIGDMDSKLHHNVLSYYCDNDTVITNNYHLSAIFFWATVWFWLHSPAIVAPETQLLLLKEFPFSIRVLQDNS